MQHSCLSQCLVLIFIFFLWKYPWTSKDAFYCQALGSTPSPAALNGSSYTPHLQGTLQVFPVTLPSARGMRLILVPGGEGGPAKERLGWHPKSQTCGRGLPPAQSPWAMGSGEKERSCPKRPKLAWLGDAGRKSAWGLASPWAWVYPYSMGNNYTGKDTAWAQATLTPPEATITAIN